MLTDAIPTREQIVMRAMELHTWRTEQFAQELYEHMQRTALPFCWECGDWHAADEEHSSTSLDCEHVYGNPANGKAVCVKCAHETQELFGRRIK